MLLLSNHVADVDWTARRADLPVDGVDNVQNRQQRNRDCRNRKQVT